MDIKLVKLGMNVNIQRSDGRVHPAAITGIDTEKRIAAVEWYENGETKGKEIDIDMIFTLNPDLRKPLAVSNRPSSRQRSIASRDKDRPISSSRKEDRKSILQDHSQSSLKMPKPVAERSGLRSRSSSHQNGQNKLAEPIRPPSRPSVVKKDARSRLPRNNLGAVAKEEIPPPLEAPVQRDSPAEEKKLKVRKSNCVKEVEKLKKNREERRAKNKDDYNARMQVFDPSNPNWEFLRMIIEYRAGLQPKPLRFEEDPVENRISVCVRKRPLNAKEIGKKIIDVITINDAETTLVHEPKQKVDLTKFLENHEFRFDYSFDEHTTNEMVYKFTARPLVHTVFENGMATCFAYGQTGSGKTHTMGGTFTSGKDQDARKGIYAMAAADIFKLQRTAKHRSKDLIVCASFFEIYCSKVFDLLNSKKKLRVLEDGKAQVQVVGLTETEVTCVEDVLHLISTGNKARTSGTTSANQHSSRSHAVFQLILRKRTTKRLHGKFSLIDLAGNERGADTSTSDRQTRMEGAEINKSLLALKECIRALGRKGAHLPFRGSVLTQVLRDSFVGDNSRTCMIAMVSPGFSCCEHTLNTLRYADRVKELTPGERQAKRRPSNSKPGDNNGDVRLPTEEEPEEDEGESSQEDLPPKAGMSPANSDLQMLHRHLKKESGGDGDTSLELLTFHEAVMNLVEAEETLIEKHKEMLDDSERLLEREKKLFSQTEGPEYNRDEYVPALKSILLEKRKRIDNLLRQIDEFQEKMVKEETASKKVKRLPFV
jgi:kinesin family protein 2/24